MNLADTQAQLIGSLKSLTPFSYDRATTISFTTCAIVTRILSSAWALTKWAAKSLQILALVTIGLGLMAIELWQNRRQVKAAINDQYLMCCLMGAMFIQLRVVIPVKELEARSRVAFATMVNGAS